MNDDIDRISAAQIEAKIFELLDSRRDTASICPSDVARALVAPQAPWRHLMPRVRTVAQALVHADRLRATRGRVEVEPTGGGGPIRLRKV